MATTRKRNPTRLTIEQAKTLVADQVAWINEHGRDLAGYIRCYGAADDPERYGNGGEAIYAADTAALAEYRAALASAVARAGVAALATFRGGTIPATEPATLTKRQSLAIMDDAGGHAWLTVSAGQKIAAAFGLDIPPHREYANTGSPKGLIVKDAKPNELVSGYSCVRLAETIANHVADVHEQGGGAPLMRVYRMQEGRGSRARSACETIAAALDVEEAAPAPLDAFGDCVAALGNGWAVRFGGCIESARWTSQGAAAAHLDLLKSGKRRPQPESRT